MNPPDSPRTRLEEALKHPRAGVVGLVDELIAEAELQPIRLTWNAEHCRVERGDSGGERFEMPLAKSVFRAALARVAFLANKVAADPISPYGGKGKIILASDGTRRIHVCFVNTTQVQTLDLARVGWASPAQTVTLS